MRFKHLQLGGEREYKLTGDEELPGFAFSHFRVSYKYHHSLLGPRSVGELNRIEFIAQIHEQDQ